MVSLYFKKVSSVTTAVDGDSAITTRTPEMMPLTNDLRNSFEDHFTELVTLFPLSLENKQRNF